MSKEWLEEAKCWLGSTFTNSNYEIVLAEDIGIPRELLKRLIEQAERVVELEQLIEYCNSELVDINYDLTMKEKQNNEYQESIKLALNHIHTGNFTLATVELNKALLKEVEQ